MAVPLNHFADIEPNGEGQARAAIHAYPKYYRDGDPATGTLLRTDMRFVPSDHPAISDWMAKAGVWSCYARNDGTYAIKHLGHTLKFKLAALVLMKPDRTWEVIATPTYGMPIADGETLTWANVFNGVDQTLRAIPDQTRDVFTISQAARDGLQSWCVNHGYTIDLDSHYLAFAYEVDYRNLDESSAFSMQQQIEGGAEFTNSENAEVKGRIFHLKDGRVKQFLAGEFRHEADEDSRTPKLLRFATVNSKRYFLEGCSLKFFRDAPAGRLIANTTVTYQEGTDAYSGCIDNWMREDRTTTNYGSDTSLFINSAASASGRTVLISWNLPDLSGATVSNAYISLKCSGTYSPRSLTVYTYQVFKPWEETDSCWNQWDKSGSKEWKTVDCGNGDDSGVENSGDGTGADRVATADGSDAIATVSGDWETFCDGAAGFKQLVQDWIDGDFTDTYGVCMKASGASTELSGWASSENSTVADRPKLTIEYTTGGSFVPYPFSRGARGGLHALSGGLA